MTEHHRSPDIRNVPVAEIMATRIEMVDEETPISFAAKLLMDKRISGLPVTDDDGVVSGMVSAVDVVRAVQQRLDSDATQRFYAGMLPRMLLDARASESPVGTAPLATDTLVGKVRDYMNRALVSVPPDATVGEAAKLMRDKRVARVLVLDSNRNLAGLVTQSDIVRLVADGVAGAHEGADRSGQS